MAQGKLSHGARAAAGAGQVVADYALGAAAGDGAAATVRHYMIQPLVELYGGCMAVLKVSRCGIRRRRRSSPRPCSR